jgi:hypothetical protein
VPRKPWQRRRQADPRWKTPPSMRRRPPRHRHAVALIGLFVIGGLGAIFAYRQHHPRVIEAAGETSGGGRSLVGDATNESPPTVDAPTPSVVPEDAKEFDSAGVAPPVADSAEEQPVPPPTDVEESLRRDPQLLPVAHLEVRSGIAAMAVRPPKEEPPGDDPWQWNVEQNNLFGLRADQFADRRHSAHATPYPAFEGVSFVVVTGLVPLMEQMGEYDRCLADLPGYDQRRDTVRYLSFVVQRAEVDSDGEIGEWTKVGDLDSALAEVDRWGGQHGENADLRYVNDRLAMPVPPLLDVDVSPWVSHSTIPLMRDVLVDDDNYLKLPDHLLFRYFDFSVRNGRHYRYRVILRLIDPNDPPQVATPAASPFAPPAAGDLSAMVNQRLAARARIEARGEDVFWRDSPSSEPSDVISLPERRKLLLRAIDADRDRDTTASVLAVVWNQKAAAWVSVAFDRLRLGEIAHQIESSLAVHPITWQVQPTRIDAFDEEILLLDFRGGDALPKPKHRPRAIPLREPGEAILLDGGGQLVVTKEIDDADFVRQRFFGRFGPFGSDADIEVDSDLSLEDKSLLD